IFFKKYLIALKDIGIHPEGKPIWFSVDKIYNLHIIIKFIFILNNEQNILQTICNTVRLNFVDSGNYETINIIHNKPLGIISWLIKK
ncbi:hypothetical protein, partial [Halanaerobium congolense]|uniref:hypothetical protein n=1 Tax=Halanaerobium congolense TaxID=54121 RepID=UPI001AAE12AE